VFRWLITVFQPFMPQDRRMVVRRRFQTFFLWLGLYVLAGGLSAYFIYHAHNGNRGIESREALAQTLAELEKTYDDLQTEKDRWQRRVDALRQQHVDQDLLQERARLLLGRVQKGEVVILNDIRTTQPAH
jgi:cell division protein FtsB